MSLTEIAIKRPSLIIVIFSILMIGGLYTYTKLNYELLPEFSQPTLVITTMYPGAAPVEVEQTVTKKIEDVIAALDGIKNITSQSYEGISVIMAEFAVGTDADEKQQEAQRKLNNIMATFPTDVKTPSISKVVPSDQPVMQLTAISTMDDQRFFDVVKDRIVPQIQQIEGVGEVTLLGGREREIQVNVDKDKLQFYNLSLHQVTQAIINANIDLPTGKVKSREEQMTLRVAGKFTSVDQISELVLINTPDNGSIKIADIANVEDSAKEPLSINRFKGQDGIGIIIKKQGDANAVEISRQIRNRIEVVKSEFKSDGIDIIIADDTSEFTLEAADAVTHDLIIAVILVAAVMLLFLHSLRDSLIVLVAIPASLLSTFIAMYLFGYSLNLMTLLAMSLVIGILVDDSIVVLENIHRHLHMGKDKVRATIDGRSEIGFSALAITMVDVVVFLPIALINTTIGEILRQYSVTIVVATLMSLFVCFTLTPWLASRFGKITVLDPRNPFHRILLGFEKLMDGFTAWYVKQLNWTLNHKIITTLAVIGAFIFTGWIMSFGILGQELVAEGDRGKFTLKLEYDKSITLTENNLRTREIERFLSLQPEVETIFTNVGALGSASMSGISSIGSENRTDLTIGLVDATLRESTEKFMIRMQNAIEQNMKGVKASVAVIGLVSGEEPIQIVLNSEDDKKLFDTAEKIASLVKSTPGANDVSVSVEEGNPELNVQIDREKMAQLGLSVLTVGSTLQTAYTGNTDAQFSSGDNEYDINVRLDAFDRNNASEVQNLVFVNNRGESVVLSQFATVAQNSSASMLERRNRRTSVTIKSNVLGTTSGKLREQINEKINELSIPAGVEWRWIGDAERQEDSFSALGVALTAAILLVYLVMVALYDNFIYPFVVLFSIPVSLIGAFIALNLAISSISIFTMLGIIMLLGLVMKNGILLVDFANHQKQQGASTRRALLEAGKARLRPIIMTTIAMVAGMIPIAIATGAGAEWKNGLAIVMMGGLLSSLMLTVFVVPMAYYVVDKIQISFSRMRSRRLTNVHA